MNEKCFLLHKWFNGLKKHTFSFNEQEIPENGIYILFEKGENAHGMQRIVRVGTHTGQGNLRNRLKEHFINENKDRSIFRKNIGRAILNKNKDPFLKEWELTPLIKEVREKHPEIDFDKQRRIEKEVSNYIQDKFSFVVFRMDDKEKRLKFESKIISTLSSCDLCNPSSGWLGLNSPKEKIRSGGLWLVNEVNKGELSDEEMVELRDILQS